MLDEILRLPEFIFEKPSYDKYHKSRLPQLPLPGYPPAIIPSDLFLLIINAFTATYVFRLFFTCRNFNVMDCNFDATTPHPAFFLIYVQLPR